MLLGLFAVSVIASTGRRGQAPGRWVWPLPRLADGRRPEISDGYHMRPSGVMHDAVDVMYRRAQPIAGKYPLPDRGSTHYDLPEHTPVLAAADAKIWSAGRDAHGWLVVLDHGKAGGGRSSVYRHLAALVVPQHKNGKQIDGSPPVVVKAGAVLGPAGFDPTDPRKVRHLHFELRQGATKFDPQPLMREWEILS